MHTHFSSGTTMIANGLNVVIFLGFWRLVWLHVAKSQNPTLQALAGAALFQG